MFKCTKESAKYLLDVGMETGIITPAEGSCRGTYIINEQVKNEIHLEGMTDQSYERLATLYKMIGRDSFRAKDAQNWLGLSDGGFRHIRAAWQRRGILGGEGNLMFITEGALAILEEKGYLRAKDVS